MHQRPLKLILLMSLFVAKNWRAWRLWAELLRGRKSCVAAMYAGWVCPELAVARPTKQRSLGELCVLLVSSSSSARLDDIHADAGGDVEGLVENPSCSVSFVLWECFVTCMWVNRGHQLKTTHQKWA